MNDLGEKFLTDASTRETLRELTKNAVGRSETARLNDIFVEVEAALSAGVKRKTVLETLHKDGFKMTLKSFDSAMKRLRDRKLTHIVEEQTPPEAVPAPVSPVAPVRPKPQAPQLSGARKVPLPNDWQTCKLTTEQLQSLSPAEEKEREIARNKFYHGTVFDELDDLKKRL